MMNVADEAFLFRENSMTLPPTESPNKTQDFQWSTAQRSTLKCLRRNACVLYDLITKRNSSGVDAVLLEEVEGPRREDLSNLIRNEANRRPSYNNFVECFIFLLLLWRYNSDRVLAFSTIAFHLKRSWTCSTHCISFIFFKSFMTSSYHRDIDLPTGLLVNGFHLYIFFTILVSGILFMCPNQLNLWALT
jgi:hypothetical protein